MLRENHFHVIQNQRYIVGKVKNVSSTYNKVGIFPVGKVGTQRFQQQAKNIFEGKGNLQVSEGGSEAGWAAGRKTGLPACQPACLPNGLK